MIVRSEAASTAAEATLAPADAQNLRELLRLLAGTSRRRDFKRVPMILDHPDQWDAAPLVTILDYQGGSRQAWDNSDLTGPWLKGMRNSINAQIWSFKQPSFLCIFATHGSAHLALFDQEMWDKYLVPAVVTAARTFRRTGER
jgi:hypothetical protein